MSTNIGRILGVAFSLAGAQPASALVQDYAFELVSSEVKQSERVTIVVRLIRKATGEAVPDAVIFAHRLDMEPDGMPTMTAPIEAAGTVVPGTYLFGVDIPMEGNWRLSLAAKLQGEDGTLQARLVVKAAP